MNELSSNWPHIYTTPYYMAAAYDALGNTDEAIEWLGRGYEVRDSWMVMVNEDPMFDGFRSDSRFQDLMRRMGFPEIRQ